MEQNNKKVEVLFKTMVLVNSIEEAALKTTLEDMFPGLKTKSIKVYAKDANIKAMVSSNIHTILEGEDESSSKRRNTSIHRPKVIADPIDTSNEVKELRMRVMELEKQLATGRVSQEMEQLFQEQVALSSRQIEKLDVEKNALENQNKKLKTLVEELSRKLSIRTEAKITNDHKSEVAALEKLIAKREKEFETEKRELQDKVNAMSLKLINEREESKKLVQQASKVEPLENSVSTLRAEQKVLSDCILEKERTIKEKEVLCDEANKRRKLAEKELEVKSKILREMEEKLREVEKDARHVETLNRLDASQLKEIELLKKEVTLLQKEMEECKSSNAKLAADFAEKNEELNQFRKVGEKISVELTQTRQALEVKEAEEMNCQETIQLKDVVIKKLEIDLKAAEAQLESISNSQPPVKSLQDQKIQTESVIDKITDNAKQLEAQYEQLRSLAEKERSLDIKALENSKAELSESNKKLRESEEAKKTLEQQLDILGAKLEVAEKMVALRTEEVKQLNAQIEKSKEEAKVQQKLGETSNEVTSLKLELDRTKQELSVLIKGLHEGRMNEGLLKKEANIDKLDHIDMLTEDLELYRGEIESLKAINSCLKIEIDERLTKIEFLQSQNESVMRENSSLRAVLAEMEISVRSNSTGTDSLNVGEPKKTIATEETIWAYKTMAIKTKEHIVNLANKRERIVSFLNVIDQLTKSSKAEEQVKIIEMLESEVAFLKGFPHDIDLQIILDCLTKVANRRNEKIADIEKEIANNTALVELSERKIIEYEQKLIQ
eukprot:TRINITY_DN7188_c0_g1_i6.p1 TRINITY_DN7188_c0_g1~~TRINITY_DN7188_c0_g1_i6.p1  ORF type:complete len:781 (+),score=245.12 TRINITY_DN7188_c0_g1_i6:734-3076(+)